MEYSGGEVLSILIRRSVSAMYAKGVINFRPLEVTCSNVKASNLGDVHIVIRAYDGVQPHWCKPASALIAMRLIPGAIYLIVRDLDSVPNHALLRQLRPVTFAVGTGKNGSHVITNLIYVRASRQAKKMFSDWSTAYKKFPSGIADQAGFNDVFSQHVGILRLREGDLGYHAQGKIKAKKLSLTVFRAYKLLQDKSTISAMLFLGLFYGFFAPLLSRFKSLRTIFALAPRTRLGKITSYSTYFAMLLAAPNGITSDEDAMRLISHALNKRFMTGLSGYRSAYPVLASYSLRAWRSRDGWAFGGYEEAIVFSGNLSAISVLSLSAAITGIRILSAILILFATFFSAEFASGCALGYLISAKAALIY